jgi:hypothetical protein
MSDPTTQMEKKVEPIIAPSGSKLGIIFITDALDDCDPIEDLAGYINLGKSTVNSMELFHIGHSGQGGCRCPRLPAIFTLEKDTISQETSGRFGAG